MSDWQLDRLPGDVRLEAENAAQREGLPLHRWLGKLIRETCAEEGVALSRELSRGVVSNAAAASRQPAATITARAPDAEPIRSAPNAEPPPAPTTTFAVVGTSDVLEPTTKADIAPPAEARAPAEPRRPSIRATPGATEAASDAVPPAARRMTPPPTQDAAASAPTSRFTPAPKPAAKPTPPSAPAASDAPQPSRFATEQNVFAIRPAAAPPLAPTAVAPIPVAPTPTAQPSRLVAETKTVRPKQESAAAPAAPITSETPAVSASPLSRVFVEPTVLAARPKQEPPAIPPSAPPMPQADDRPAALKKLVQSLRRNELSPIGESRLYLKLMTEYVASIAELSTATGRTREQITRALRLLSLPDRQRDLIERGALSREQAYALLDAENSEAAANPASPGTIGRPQ